MKGFLLIVLGLILAFVFLVYLFQGKLIYIPRGYYEGMKAFEKVDELAFTSGGKAQFLYLSKREASAPIESVWWVFGGNGSVALDWVDVATSPGLGGSTVVVLFDYPGYGKNAGSPNPERIAHSVDVAFPLVAERLGMSQEMLVSKSRTLGHSLGAAVALDTAARYQLDEVIAISPFTTMKEMAKRTMGSWAGALLSHRYDNEVSVDRILKSGHPTKITIFHGEADKLIPIAMGKSLAARDQSGKTIEFIAVPDVGHNDIVIAILGELRNRVAK